MDFWEAMCQPAFIYESYSDDNDEELKELKKQNKMLKTIINRLIQEGRVEERQVRKMVNVSPNQIEFNE